MEEGRGAAKESGKGDCLLVKMNDKINGCKVHTAYDKRVLESGVNCLCWQGRLPNSSLDAGSGAEIGNALDGQEGSRRGGRENACKRTKLNCVVCTSRDCECKGRGKSTNFD